MDGKTLFPRLRNPQTRQVRTQPKLYINQNMVVPLYARELTANDKRVPPGVHAVYALVDLGAAYAPVPVDCPLALDLSYVH